MHAMGGCFYDISVALVLFMCTCSRSSYQAIQKQVALMVVVVMEAEGKNSIDMNSFYDFHQSWLRSNNLRDMLLSYDSIDTRVNRTSSIHD